MNKSFFKFFLAGFVAIQHFVPVDGVVYDVSQLEIDFFNFFLDTGDVLVRFILVELQDACHLDFHEAKDILLDRPGFLPSQLVQW